MSVDVYDLGSCSGANGVSMRERERGFFLFPDQWYLWPNLGRMGEKTQTEALEVFWSQTWKDSRKINSVYVVGFWEDAGCELICINNFPVVFLAGCGIHHRWHCWKARERRTCTIYKNITSLGSSKPSEVLLIIENNLRCLPWLTIRILTDTGHHQQYSGNIQIISFRSFFFLI